MQAFLKTFQLVRAAELSALLSVGLWATLDLALFRLQLQSLPTLLEIEFPLLG